MKSTNRLDKTNKTPEHYAFKRLAEERGWTRYQVAKLLETNSNYAQEILRLSVFPSPRVLANIKSVLAMHQVL